MTALTLAIRSFQFHWYSHLGTILGCAVGSAVLVGALLVGDSVRYSLQRLAQSRLGEIQYGFNTGDRVFRAALAQELQQETNAPIIGVLQLIGAGTRSDGTVRANNVQVVGVPDAFWQLCGQDFTLDAREDEVFVNERLALQLQVKAGDTIILRVSKPQAISRDAPMTPQEDVTAALRVKIKKVLTADTFGNYSLKTDQVPPYNAFVPLSLLQQKAEAVEQINGILVGSASHLTEERLTAALHKCFKPEDAALTFLPISELKQIELRTPRVFIENSIAEAVRAAIPDAQPILTYFVNTLKSGTAEVPYSMVTGMGAPVIPEDMPDQGIVINQWVADDMKCKVGDPFSLTFFKVTETRKLEEETVHFTVQGIVPIAGAAGDRNLMPDFPGIAKANSCREWDASLPIDSRRIRKDIDEPYWNRYRGTPKAFVTFRKAQEMWQNRFGAITAFRIDAEKYSEAQLRTALTEKLKPQELGFQFIPFSKLANQASVGGVDFGGLFIGMSFFLIVAAMLLMSLLFQFGIERRAPETGTLLAVGFTPRQVRKLLILEGLLLAALGSIVGVIAGTLYAQAMLYGLATIWQEAVQSAAIVYHGTTTTYLAGLLGGLAAGLATIYLSVRRQAQRPARELLAAGIGTGQADSVAPATSNRSLILAVSALVIALGLIGSGHDAEGMQAAGVFFGAGSLLLIAGIALGSRILNRLATSTSSRPGVIDLGIRNTARRKSRSLATIGLLACGSFMVLAVGAFRQDASANAERRTSGTGGFALFGATGIPIVENLNTPKGYDTYGLTAKEMENVHTVHVRLREGDNASCLNLTAAQQPQLWGIEPIEMAGRFSFAQTLYPVTDDAWRELLEHTEADGSIPAIGDMNTIMWGLKTGVGKTVEYMDGNRNPFKLKIVGSVNSSILQGTLIISEKNFVRKFPTEGGYRILMIDAPREKMDALSAIMMREMANEGLELKSAVTRLAEFNAVQNTYLATFQILGGLGLLLGSIGLGILVLRNVLERRSELALLRAVGFRIGTLRLLVASEHGLLLIMGLICGIVAAAVAVIPALRSPEGGLPYGFLGLLLLAVVASGAVSTAMAAAWALKGQLLEALRSEGQ